jgi:hypothetical protein
MNSIFAILISVAVVASVGCASSTHSVASPEPSAPSLTHSPNDSEAARLQAESDSYRAKLPPPTRIGSFLIALKSATIVRGGIVLAVFGFDSHTANPPYVCVRVNVSNVGQAPATVPQLMLIADGALYERTNANAGGFAYYKGTERYNPNEGNEFVLFFSGTTNPEYLVAKSGEGSVKLKIPPPE